MLDPIYGRFAESGELQAVVLTTILSIIGWLFVRFISPKAKLYWGVSSNFSFYLHQNRPQSILVPTRILNFENTGKAPVEDLEITFNGVPEHYDVLPPRQFTTSVNIKNELTLHFPSLNKKEILVIALLSEGGTLPEFVTVRHRGGMGKQVPLAPRRVFPGWLIRTEVLLAIIGIISVGYWLIRALQIFLLAPTQ